MLHPINYFFWKPFNPTEVVNPIGGIIYSSNQRR